MTAALRIALKDLRLRVRDGSVFIWGVVAPLGLAIVFSLLLGGVTDSDALDVHYVVVDADGGPIGGGLVELLEDLESQGILSVEAIDDPAAAEGLVRSGEADAAILIPTGLSGAVTEGGTAVIDVIGYVDSPIGSQVARAIVEQFAGEVNGIAVSVVTYTVVAGDTDHDSSEIVAAAQQVPSPLTFDTVSATSKELSSGSFYAASMAVFFLFFTVQFGVIGLIEEREQGTLPRLLAAPIPPWSVLAGKVITAFVIGVVSMGILIITTALLPFMDAEWGDPLGVTVLVVAGVLSAMGVMLLVAAFARTAETAGSIQAVIAFVLGMLGGAFFPVAQAGGIFTTLSKIAPHSWFLRGLGDLAAGGGVTDVLPEAGFILLFAAITAGLASLRLSRTVTP